MILIHETQTELNIFYFLESILFYLDFHRRKRGNEFIILEMNIICFVKLPFHDL